ncbi:SRPBCC family protein [Leptolyngbya iicbica]|uniref:SRPBCC family protein n=1 Tax=Leptolyngbya iicbica TaxID=3161580 RepID=UPI00349E6780
MVEVDAPVQLTWELWSDLEQMPKWMKWIDSVNILEEDPDLSRWKLASAGFEFTWLSRVTKLVPYQLIQWEAVDGLPNRGGIRFYDHKEKSAVKLTVAYSIPSFIGKLMDNLIIGRLVESTLKADLKRFKKYVDNIQQGQSPSS